MKKAVIKIKVEYDHSYMFDDMQVIDAIEGIGSNIVTLINNPGSPLWPNFGAQATVNAVGSNVYVDKVDMPIHTYGPDFKPANTVLLSDNKPKGPNDELWERAKNAAPGEWVAIDPESKVSGFIRYAKDIPDELDTMSKEDMIPPKTPPLPNPSPNTMRLHKVIHDLEEKVAKLEAVNGKLSIENHIKEQLINTHCDDTIITQQAKANELDRYAIPAMQGMLAGRLAFHDVMDNAIKAYDQAEAMITERNKRTQ